jgi:hypothetical protein
LLARHESVRTHFAEVDGEPVRVIEPELRIEVPLEDLAGLDEQARHERVRQELRQEVSKPFDLSGVRCCG